MTRLTYILLLFPLLSFGQQSNRPKLTASVMNEYVQDGLEHGVDARYHLQHDLQGVYFVPREVIERYVHEKDHRAGTVAKVRNDLMNRYEVVILIDEKYSEADQRAFLYHELGHFFGLEHGSGLMSKQINHTFLTEQNKELFWRQINNTPPSKYMNPIPFAK